MFIATLCTINAMWNFTFFVVYEARSAVGAATTLLVDFNLKRGNTEKQWGWQKSSVTGSK